jgi:hypothetical protein
MTDVGMDIPDWETFRDEWLPTLEQYDVIEQDNARHWYEVTKDIEPERFKWHFERLRGPGGTGIGEIVAATMKEPALFSTLTEIAKSKLMITTPEKPDKVMRRGIVLEPITQQFFYDDCDAVQATEAVNAINNAHYEDTPWIVGNVDDVVTRSLGGLAKKKLIVVDYKASAEDHDDAPIQYKGQTHFYRAILTREMEEGRVKIEGFAPEDIELAIVYFDYQSGSVNIVDIPYSEEIEEAALNQGALFWEKVKVGDLAGIKEMEYVHEEPEEIDYSEEQLENIASLEDKWSTLNLMKSVTESFANEALKELISALSQDGEYALRGRKDLPLSMGTSSVRFNLNEEQVEALLSRRNIPLDTVLSDNRKLDTDAMERYLLREGVDTSQFITKKMDQKKVDKLFKELNVRVPGVESPSISLRACKKLSKEDIDAAKSEVKLHISDLAESLNEANNPDDLDDEYAMQM